MSNFGTIAVGLGAAVVIVTGSVVGGIIGGVINDGENHKIKMTTAPPPAPPPGARRALEHDEIYGRGNPQFELTKKERAIFSTLARRQSASGQRAR
jgi:hypothetical protein